ncbi:MAG: T9SS type A sorting domain-containing protein [Flavobacteriales bacterium]
MKFFTVIIAILVSIAAYAQAPGSLDLSFAGTGYASYGPVASNFMDNAQDVVTLANGKMIYCGTSGMTSSLGIVVVRLNCDGTIDNTFGTNGYYLYNAPGGSSFAYDMELLPSGQLLIAGATSITAANPQFTMLRLNSNGTLDQTFGVNGFFNNDIGSGEDYARKILIQNNKIILVGASKTPGFSTNRLALTQCDMNGVLDLTFGTNGTTVFQNAANNSCFGQSAVIGNNNDIFICGDAYINNVYYPLLAKVSATGVPYAAFGSNGVLIPMNFNARFFDIEYDGSKLIMAGQNNVGPWDFLLQARNTTDGALVTTFGTAGSSIIDVVQADTYYELLIHPDGSLLACGTTGTAGIGAARDFIISKYNANGILQTSFGTNGHTITNIAPAWDDAYGMDLYPGNKIVVAGFSAQTNTQHAVARYAYGPATPVLGCTDPLSCNYNCLATINDGSCLYPNTACDDGNPQTINDSTNANCVCAGQIVITPIPGCMNPAACNYNPLATVDDGSCLFPGALCDDGNPNTINDSINPDCVCIGNIIVEGCMDPNSCSYDSLANVDNNSCIYPDSPCDDNNPDTFNDILDSLCNCVGTLYVSGCMDPNACNYNPLANIDDQSCILPGSPCDDGNALTINDSLDVNCNCVGLDVSGLNEHLFEFELNPNPATDLLLLVTSSVALKTICIVDLQGKVLKEMYVNGTTQLIDCSTLASGTYLIKVRMNGVEKMKKLVIQH